MKSALVMLAGMVVVVASAAAQLSGPQRLRAARQETFERLRFPSRDGVVLTGAQVRVVKQRYGRFDGMQQPEPRWMAQTADDAFWYCVGPGPSWYLAIPVSRRNGFQWDVEWVVRPLDESRMRAALNGDTEALRLAFGEDTERG
jgi:hypothetical protein